MPTRIDFARSVIRRGGWTVTTALLQGLVAVMVGEGSHARFNPLDTTQPWPGSTSYNSVGVRNYATWDDGVAATVATLRNGYYPDVIAVLNAGGPADRLVVAWANSPWGTWQGDPQAALRTLQLVLEQWPRGICLEEVAGSGAATEQPSSEEDLARRIAGMVCEDPITGGFWVTDELGEVYSFDGAPYLGGLNTHPDWHAGGPANPCVGIAPWRGDGTDEAGNGYVLACQPHPSVTPTVYRFPRSGIYVVRP